MYVAQDVKHTHGQNGLWSVKHSWLSRKIMSLYKICIKSTIMTVNGCGKGGLEWDCMRGIVVDGLYNFHCNIVANDQS